MFNVGDVIEVMSNNAAGWIITQNAGQNMYLGMASTTVGTSGNLHCAALGTTLVLRGIVANTTLMVLGAPQGSVTVV